MGGATLPLAASVSLARPASIARPPAPQKASELAWSPAKGFMMSAFMLVRPPAPGSHSRPYARPPSRSAALGVLLTPTVRARRRAVRSQWMSGSGVHIFSIMITFNYLQGPIRQIFGVNKAFTPFDDPKYGAAEKAQLLTSKLMFVALNLVAMGGALYKMGTMGLLPTTASDWISFLRVSPNAQVSSGSTV